MDDSQGKRKADQCFDVCPLSLYELHGGAADRREERGFFENCSYYTFRSCRFDVKKNFDRSSLVTTYMIKGFPKVTILPFEDFYF